MDSARTSTAFMSGQTALRIWRILADSGTNLGQIIIAFIDRERQQLPIWMVVAFATGIAAWFGLGGRYYWIAFIALLLGSACLFMLFAGSWHRLGVIGRIGVMAPVLMAAGCGAIWAKSVYFAPPTLTKPFYGMVTGHIISRENIPARKIVRFVLKLPEKQGFPIRVRVNLDEQLATPAMAMGAIIQANMRLMPPAQSALPGSYNFARRVWFEGLGASGTILSPPKIIATSDDIALLAQYRLRLSAHIQSRIDGSAGAIAATLATGDRGAIAEDDAEAMRRSGLAHLLSISGLHVSALIAASWIFFMRTTAFSPLLARRFKLPLYAALFSACVGIGYTLLTGAQVPTIRACIAAILVLLALAMGRDPISLRLVATGALMVLLIWPEALVGPSFQMSFAAVTVIIALHGHPAMRRGLNSAETSGWRRLRNAILALFLTGLAIELALMPIALFHFHKAGIYGALANLVAIPLTTFIIMPLEAVALCLDIFGLGAPIWWLCGLALNGLIALAQAVSSAPGAVTLLPSMGNIVFGLFIFGGLWLCLWRSSARFLALIPIAIACLALALQTGPDILITSDGRHLAVRHQGDFIMLRGGAPDGYALSMIRENAGAEQAPLAMDQWPKARCSDSFCSFAITGQGADQGRTYTILASRNTDYVPPRALYAACRRADIVISDRTLPRYCRPLWFKADKAMLRKTGGLALYLDKGYVHSVADENAGHPWFDHRFSKTE